MTILSKAADLGSLARLCSSLQTDFVLVSCKRKAYGVRSLNIGCYGSVCGFLSAIDFSKDWNWRFIRRRMVLHSALLVPSNRRRNLANAQKRGFRTG